MDGSRSRSGIADIVVGAYNRQAAPPSFSPWGLGAGVEGLPQLSVVLFGAMERQAGEELSARESFVLFGSQALKLLHEGALGSELGTPGRVWDAQRKPAP